MSYEVLARKWRPRGFPELVGQDHVRQALVNALDSGRLHHAYLFTGTRGVGKTTIARILAKSLNCETHGASSAPCGECSACREIDEGRFVDLVEVDAASRSRVDETRELLENVPYAPTRGRYKVYLVDEVHMFSASSFNALLKTLEEPPPHVKFLLATTDPQKVPVTILSRCLQFNLKLMPAPVIAEHLERVLTAEAIEFEAPALGQIARAAAGSMRDALSLLDQAISFGDGAVRAADVEGMLGTLSRDRLFALAEALAAHDAEALVREADGLAQAAADLEPVLAELMSLLHQIALAQTVPDAVDESVAEAERVRELAARMAPADVQLYYQIATLGRRDLTWAPDPRTGLEMTLLRMVAFRPAGEADSGADRSVPGESAPVSGKAVARKSVPTSTRSPDGGDSRNPGEAGTASVRAGGGSDAASLHPGYDRPATRSETSATSEPAPGPESASEPKSKSVSDEPRVSEPPAAPAPPVAKAAAKTETADAPPPAESAARVADAPADWESIVAALPLRGLAAGLGANTALLGGLEEGRPRLALAPDNAHLGGERYRQRLEAALGQYLGRTIRVELVHEAPDGVETPAAADQRRAESRRARAQQAIEGDPVVQALQQRFGARVRADSIQPVDPGVDPGTIHSGATTNSDMTKGDEP